MMAEEALTVYRSTAAVTIQYDLPEYIGTKDIHIVNVLTYDYFYKHRSRGISLLSASSSAVPH